MASIGSAPGIILGTGVGFAASAALAPAVEVPKQEAWASAPNRILDVVLLARLAAQGGIDLSTAEDDAKRDGYGRDKLDALIYLEQTVPGSGEAISLWRLGLIGDDLFRHALVKAGLDTRYADAIIARKTAEPLGLGDIAYAVVRGIVPAPSYVPVPVPATGEKVPRYPVVNVDPEELAAKLGYSPEALQIMVGRSGLSMAPGMAAQALFREIIGPDDYTIAIGEGDLRTEWADPVLEVSRQILTAGEYAELELRGYYDRPTRLKRTAQHGMSERDSDDLYDVMGRGLSLHQAFIGARRGGTLNGDTSQIPEYGIYQLQRGNLRPEVFNLAWAGRETLPSAFVVRALLQGGAITQQEGETLFLHMGWPEDLAAKVAAHYGTTTTGAADAHVTKAQTQLWTTTHRSYISAESDDATATAALEAAGVDAGSVPAVLQLWAKERELVRKQLTPAQIKKAFKEAAINAETQAAWTRDEALAALIARGYSPTDADSFLNI